MATTTTAAAVESIGNMTNEDLDVRINTLIGTAMANQNNKIHNLELKVNSVEERLETIDGRIDKLLESISDQKSALDGFIREQRDFNKELTSGNKEQSERWNKAFAEVKDAIAKGPQVTNTPAPTTTPAPAPAGQPAANAQATQTQAANTEAAAAGAAAGAKKSEWKPIQIGVTALVVGAAAGTGGYMYGRRRGQRMAEHQGDQGGGAGGAGGRGRAAMH